MTGSVTCTVCRTPSRRHDGDTGYGRWRSVRAMFILAALSTGCDTLVVSCERQYPRDLNAKLGPTADAALLQRVTGESAYLQENTAILVEVSSSTDWVGRAQQASATTQLEGQFCEWKDHLARVASPFLFANGQRIASRSGGRKADGNLPLRDEDGLFVAQGFIHVRDDGNGTAMPSSVPLDRDQEYYRRFDLEQNPRDICLYVRGGTMWLPLFHYRSNVVVVPKEEIAAALGRTTGSFENRRSAR